MSVTIENLLSFERSGLLVDSNIDITGRKIEGSKEIEDYGVNDRKKAELAVKYFGTKVTGVRPGETIAGNRTITAGTILNYRAPIGVENPNSYIIPPLKKSLDRIRLEPDLWDIFINKLETIPFFGGMTYKHREMWMKDFQSDKDIDISEVGGEIEILQLGKGDLVEKLTN